MMSSFEEVLIGDVCSVGDGAHSKVKRIHTGVPYLTSKNIGQGNLKLEKLDYISEESFEKLFPKSSKATRRPQRGDVLFGIIGTFGNAYLYKEDDHFGFSSSIGVLRPDPEKIDSEYLYYVVSSRVFKSNHANHNAGSVQGYTNIPTVKSLSLPLPPLVEQRRISKILKSLDDKIELNRQTNQTLEHIAQAIFKSWFVDFEPTRAKIAAKQIGQARHDSERSAALREALLADGRWPEAVAAAIAEGDPERAAMAAISGKSLDELDQLNPEQREQLRTTTALFPDALVDSELGEIPEAWGIKSLSEIIEVIGGGTPKRSEESYWGGDIPWFSVKDAPSLSDVFVVDTIEQITEQGVNKSSTKLLPVGTTIITARGTVGKLALTGTPMCMNQSCYGIRGLDGFGPYFNYFNLREAITTLQRNTHGAVFDTITTQTFESYSMPIATGELVDNFEDVVTPLLKKIEMNSREITTLNKLRDVLLPKLLSGELATNPTIEECA